MNDIDPIKQAVIDAALHLAEMPNMWAPDWYKEFEKRDKAFQVACNAYPKAQQDY